MFARFSSYQLCFHLFSDTYLFINFIASTLKMLLPQALECQQAAMASNDFIQKEIQKTQVGQDSLASTL